MRSIRPPARAKLKATFSNAHNTLWPGQYVNARVLVRTARDALTLPTAAVQLGPNGPFTYVVKADSTVEVRLLKIGEESGGMTVVNSGLTLDERVVTSNQYRLQPGAHVRSNSQRGFRRRGQGARQGAHEHFSPIRPAADRHLAVDGRHIPGRAGGVPAVARGASAAGRFPHRFWSPPSCRAPAPKPWPPRSPRRWNTSSPQISGLSQMTSTNVLGTSQITLQFDLNRNIDAAAQDVQTGIDAAGGQLPKNLPSPPSYRKVNPADSAILILAVHSDVLPVTTVDDYAENILAQQISQIPGHRAGDRSAASRSRRYACKSTRPNWRHWACRWRMWQASSPPPRWTRPKARSTVRRAA